MPISAFILGAMVQSHTTSTPTEVLAGLVERVTFHNEENGFCVLRVKARGQRDLITVLGHAAMINDRTHGVQFRASFLKATTPTTVEGIEKYLGSGMIRGIGPIYARKLVQAFGETVFEVIQQEPDRLREVTGIGPKRAARIIAGWAEQKVIREIMLFLHSNGAGTSRAVRSIKPTARMPFCSSRRTPIGWHVTSVASASVRRIRSRPSSVSRRPR
jgi:exodeoxyribonuclease V alpha subunit